jgi:hypothetical protein
MPKFQEAASDHIHDPAHHGPATILRHPQLATARGEGHDLLERTPADLPSAPSAPSPQAQRRPVPPPRRSQAGALQRRLHALSRRPLHGKGSLLRPDPRRPRHGPPLLGPRERRGRVHRRVRRVALRVLGRASADLALSRA